MKSLHSPLEEKGKGGKPLDSDGKRTHQKPRRACCLLGGASVLGRQLRARSNPGFSENGAACFVLGVLGRPIKSFLCLSEMLKMEPVAATSARAPQE